MDRLSQEQRRRNVAADDTWTLYAPHRARVAQLLLEASSSDAKSLMLLGAGNLNDIDLTELLRGFREIVLVDVDGDALRRGLVRQGLESDPRIHCVAPTDVTGLFADLAAMSSDQPVENAVIDRCLQTLSQTPGSDWRRSCDVVGSVGLLTQLIDGVVRSVGESHPRFWEVVSAVRAQHLRLMLELTAPSGAAVLVTEVVSSDSCPALLSVNESALPGLLRREIAARNFFTGTNPAALQSVLRSEVGIVEHLADARFTEPWLWPFVARTYAVYAVMMRKRV